jgi:hypothetical protein
MDRLKTAAILCRYAHQDYFRIIGRDPITQPMTILERELFAHCIVELYNQEAKKSEFPEVATED